MGIEGNARGEAHHTVGMEFYTVVMGANLVAASSSAPSTAGAMRAKTKLRP